jgi:hypothetical protein
MIKYTLLKKCSTKFLLKNLTDVNSLLGSRNRPVTEIFTQVGCKKNNRVRKTISTFFARIVR